MGHHRNLMFQYISCYSLSWWKSGCNDLPEVSIHLMLLFIDMQHTAKDWKCRSFNTSHVTLYLVVIRLHVLHLICFNTSHVTLYLYNGSRVQNGYRFNTSHVTLYRTQGNSLHHSIYRFNTSHVTLYQARDIVWELCLWFQYISCYSLSSFGGLLGWDSLFQYISCYSLSEEQIS